MEKLLRDVVIVSRKWNRQEVTTRVNITDEAIYLSVPLDEFVSGIISELGPVTWVFTKAETEKRIKEAVDRAVKSIKQESKKGV